MSTTPLNTFFAVACFCISVSASERTYSEDFSQDVMMQGIENAPEECYQYGSDDHWGRPGMDGLTLLNRIRETCPDLPVIIMTAHSDLDSAVSAFHGGAFEYLPKPFDIDEAVEQVRRACRHSRQAQQVVSEDPWVG